MNRKLFIVTGISGQDGAYMCKYLLDKNYDVVAATRGIGERDLQNLILLKVNLKRLKFEFFDLSDTNSIQKLIIKYKPSHFFNFAAQSYVASSWDVAQRTLLNNTSAVLTMLETIKLFSKHTKFYQASTSEMFGNSNKKYINETTPFNPVSPYGIFKLAAHNLVVNYRQTFGLHCVAGILFNHESPIRGLNFVTRKITNSFAKLKLAKIKQFTLGNFHAQRDWGYAEDYIDAAYLMLNDKKADDYVIGTGKTYSIKYLVEITAKIAGIDIEYINDPKNKKSYFIEKNSGTVIISSSAENVRKHELHYLRADMSKFKKRFNWKHSVNFKQLITNMYQSDYDREKKN